MSTQLVISFIILTAINIEHLKCCETPILGDFESCPTRAMGYVVKDVNLANLTESDIEKIKSALVKHGVIAFRGQKLTRKQQLDFTLNLGELMPLPKVLDVKDPELGFENLADFQYCTRLF